MNKIIAIICILFISTILVQEAYAVTKSCHCVAFRLDDIQNFFLNNVQIEIIDIFQKNNVSLTIAVIGNYFGEDQKIVNYLKEKLQKNYPPIEIANHGWNHENFLLFNKTDQSILLQNTNRKISTVLGVTPSVFVTPYNALNSDTFLALQENNLKYISANRTGDPPPYPLSNTTTFRLPSIALTGNLNDDDTEWITFSHNETYAQILDSLLNYGFAVVMMHPQDYSVKSGLNYTNEVDWNQIHELEMLIDKVRDNGLKIVTIGDIPQNVNTTQKVPKWIKNIFVWYADEKISADEVIDAIRFLTDKEIIIIQYHG